VSGKKSTSFNWIFSKIQY